MLHIRRFTIVAVVAVFAIAGAFPVAGPMPAANAALFSVSEQQEIQIGREVERQLAQKPGFVDDPGLTRYLSDIGHRLAAVSERPNLPWTYHILRDDSVNAIAAPGGFIFATRGLFGFVKSQDELGFVIGHETTHVAHRHAVDLAQRDMEVQFGAAILTQLVFGGNYSAYILSQVGRQMIDAKFSRDKEFEADHYGVIFARKAGFDPTQSLAFFDRLRKQEKTQPGLTHAFENHPDTPARIAAVCTELGGMGYHVACPVAPAAAGPVTPRPAAPAPGFPPANSTAAPSPANPSLDDNR
ncbi:MAG TPA: M48 family metalloprotease [bacterium]|nr:M48 family metalloprotease [bacterium]